MNERRTFSRRSPSWSRDRDRRDEMGRGRRAEYRNRDYHEDSGRPDARERRPDRGQRDYRDRRGDDGWACGPRSGANDGRSAFGGANSRRATSRRLSSTSRALSRWPSAARVQGAANLSGVTATSVSDGTTSPRVTTASLSTGTTTSPRIIIASATAALSTTPAVARRSAGFPTARPPARYRRGVWACHLRKSSGVRRQQPWVQSMGVR